MIFVVIIVDKNEILQLFQFDYIFNVADDDDDDSRRQKFMRVFRQQFEQWQHACGSHGRNGAIRIQELERPLHWLLR